jgi:hypothetical protein
MIQLAPHPPAADATGPCLSRLAGEGLALAANHALVPHWLSSPFPAMRAAASTHLCGPASSPMGRPLSAPILGAERVRLRWGKLPAYRFQYTVEVMDRLGIREANDASRRSLRAATVRYSNAMARPPPPHPDPLRPRRAERERFGISRATLQRVEMGESSSPSRGSAGLGDVVAPLSRDSDGYGFIERRCSP